MHFKSTCPPDGHPEQLDLSTDQKDMIVQVHNRYRSQVAIGNVSGYEPAANMLEMVSTLKVKVISMSATMTLCWRINRVELG